MYLLKTQLNLVIWLKWNKVFICLAKHTHADKTQSRKRYRSTSGAEHWPDRLVVVFKFSYFIAATMGNTKFNESKKQHQPWNGKYGSRSLKKQRERWYQHHMDERLVPIAYIVFYMAEVKA